MAIARSAALGFFALLVLGTGPAAADASVALIAPWSTFLPYAAVGTLRGTELRLDALNAAGGLLGEKLRSFKLDDGCDRLQALAAAKAAVALRPVVVIGGACAASAGQVSRLLADARLLQIVPNVPQEEVTDLGIPTLFRNSPRSDREGAFAADLIASRYRERRIALADNGQPHWHEAVVALTAALAERGVTPALITRFAINQSSYADFIEEMKAKRIELLYLNGLPPDMGLIVRGVAEAGLQIPILVSRNGRVDAFRQTAGAAIEGVMFTDRRDETDSALADPLLAAEKARGGDLNVFLLSAYVAMTVWSDSVRAAGSFDAAAVAARIKGRTFRTALGALTYQANGDLTPESEEWVWYRWHGGQSELVE